MTQNCCTNKKTITTLAQLSKFLKIVGEENRIKILCLLKRGKKCVCDISRYLGLPQNLVSHHLKMLKDLEIISSKQEGLKTIYALNKKVIKKYTKLLNKYLNLHGK